MFAKVCDLQVVDVQMPRPGYYHMYDIYAILTGYDKSRNHDSFRLSFKNSIFIFLSGVKVSIRFYWCFMIYQLRRMRVLWAPRIH